MFLKSRGRVIAVAVTSLAIIVLLSIWIAGTEAERTNRAQADKLSIQGFTRTAIGNDGNGGTAQVLYYFGSASADIGTLIFAPDLTFNRTIDPGRDSLYEEVGRGSFPAPGGQECDLIVQRLRAGQRTLPHFKLSATQIDEVEKGQATVAVVSLEC